MSELLIGAGNSRGKKLVHELSPNTEFADLTTLDICGEPDVLHDLNDLPYPFEDASFDEIHAYEVLEHCGTQGDENFFFAQFNEFHRILKKDGLFCLSVPNYQSIWAFGDPGHSRVLPHTVFNYLQESFYDQVGKTACADYRHLINGYWTGVAMKEVGDNVFIILKA